MVLRSDVNLLSCIIQFHHLQGAVIRNDAYSYQCAENADDRHYAQQLHQCKSLFPSFLSRHICLAFPV